RVADRPRRADRPGDGRGHRLDRLLGAVDADRTLAPERGRAQWHRIRSRDRPPARDRQELALGLRDRARLTACPAVARPVLTGRPAAAAPSGTRSTARPSP